MSEKVYDLMNWADVEEIEYSESQNPKGILGPHKIDGGTMVQVYLPHAVSVNLMWEREIQPMEAADNEGFFALWVPAADFDYQLEVTYDNGYETILEDPYNPKFKSVFTEEDYRGFAEGTACHLYQKLGAHPMELAGVPGVNFAVFAPEAERVSVVGNFNLWDGRRHQMQRDTFSGVFELFIPGLTVGELYKYEIKTKAGEPILKADPYGCYSELRPATASIVWDLHQYAWGDDAWLAKRRTEDRKKLPMNIYELHLGSWKQRPLAVNEDGTAVNGSQFYNYRELAVEIAAYVKEMGYTHIELMPVMEHPFDGSWGYQVTGYFAPTSRFGTPDDFMFFMDYMHQQGIGVILDWVPAHFPKDACGLALFDGSHVYEHADPRKGEHPHWGTLIFNYTKPQVMNFLISNAVYWVEQFHADGIRLDAVASMLYLDYGRNEGEWVPNIYGGNENLDAIAFLKQLNDIMHKQDPDIMMIAEESTAWPLVTGSTEEGGLGFDFKWNMGFMNDFLHYMQTDPFFRKDNYGALTFSILYNYSERFILVFSHDEVVHLKGSMFSKMPSSDFEEKARNLRTAYGYFMTHPDKKLLFMGQDFAQNDEWQECMSLEWDLLQYPLHKNMQNYVKALNHMYTSHPALWEQDYDAAGFEWINCSYTEESMIIFLRKTEKEEDTLLVICNFDNIDHPDFKVGVPFAGTYKEILNSNDTEFGGDGTGNPRALRAKLADCDDRAHSIRIHIPPMSTLVFSCKPEKKAPGPKKPKAADSIRAEKPKAKAAAAEPEKEAAKRKPGRPAKAQAEAVTKAADAKKPEQAAKTKYEAAPAKEKMAEQAAGKPAPAKPAEIQKEPAKKKPGRPAKAAAEAAKKMTQKQKPGTAAGKAQKKEAPAPKASTRAKAVGKKPKIT